MQLSVVIITYNEEANIGRTLASVQPLVADGKGEVIVVDSGSTDRTVEIAKSFGAKVFVEEWKGFAGQKNSAIEKATGNWIFSLDADEEVSTELGAEITRLLFSTPVDRAATPERIRRMRYLFTRRTRREFRRISKEHAGSGGFIVFVTGFWIPRRNHFLGKWTKHGGYWPDPKMR